MSAPSSYPRIPHVVQGRGTADDRVLDSGEVASLLAQDVVVEEKLDGANVVVWFEDGVVECALRSGVGAADRAGQLGPLRAWLAERTDPLRRLLTGGVVLYAEWLLLSHTISYDRLPDYLVALDLWSADPGFATPDARDQLCGVAGLAVPPALWRGRATSVTTLERLLDGSRLGAEEAEGLVIRTVDGSEPRIAKLLRPGFSRIGDEAWARGRRPRNLLADREGSWH